MKKVIVSIAMSLDGYIADINGGVDWIADDGTDCSHAGSYPAFIDTVDTIILGYNTYRQIVTKLSPEAWAYLDKQSYVLTHREQAPQEGIIFTNQDPGALIAVIWQLLALAVIDRLCISIAFLLFHVKQHCSERFFDAKKPVHVCTGLPY